MFFMLLLQIHWGNTYYSEQKCEEIVAARLKRRMEEIQQARRQTHNVSQLGCTRLGRIQKPAGRVAASHSSALEKMKNWLG
jgi:hypothetical protein